MNRTVRQLLALTRLDLRRFFSDSRALIMLFVVPIGVASFMSYVFGGTGGSGGRSGPSGLNLVLVDLDNSAVSRGVIGNFAGDSTFRVTVTNESAARQLVLTGKQPVALVLPAGFGADVFPGLFDTHRKPVLTLLHDPSRSMEKAMIEGLLVPKVVQSVIQHGISVELGRDSLRRGLTNLDRAGNLSAGDRRRFRDLMVRADEFLATRTNRPPLGADSGSTPVRTADGFTFPSPYITRSEPLTRSATGEYNGYAHSFAGMGLQFVLMSMLDLAVGLLRDREAGMFRRLRSAPLARGTMLFGKGISLSLISLLSLGGCFAFAMIVFKVRIEGSWTGFVACLVATSAMSASLGLAIAALGRTPAGTRGIGIAVVLLLVMIGGAWVPAFIFPQWLQRISLVTPTRWAVDGFDAMTWRGLGLDAALVPVGILLGFTAIFAALTWVRFRWDSE